VIPSTRRHRPNGWPHVMRLERDKTEPRTDTLCELEMVSLLTERDHFLISLPSSPKTATHHVRFQERHHFGLVAPHGHVTGSVAILCLKQEKRQK
jgi:hypothetical protein